jgi:hypothetical protein
MKTAVSVSIFIGIFLIFIGNMGCDSNPQPDPYEVFIDSAVNARMNIQRLKLASRNDSILIALEIARADSLARLKQAQVQSFRDTSNKVK